MSPRCYEVNCQLPPPLTAWPVWSSASSHSADDRARQTQGENAWLSLNPSESKVGLELCLRRGRPGASSPSACRFYSRGLRDVPSGSQLRLPRFQVCKRYRTGHTQVFHVSFLSCDHHSKYAGQVVQIALPILYGRRNDISVFSMVSVTNIDAEKQQWDLREKAWRQITWAAHDITPSPLSGWTPYALAVTLSRRSRIGVIWGQNSPRQTLFQNFSHKNLHQLFPCY